MPQKLVSSCVLAAGVLATGTALAAPPAWSTGKDPKYKREVYILGAGKGNTSDAADSDARAEISRVFESKVAAVFQSFEGAASAVNGSGKGVSIEVQQASNFTKVTTAKTLKGVEIAERAKDGALSWSLATLNREQCINSLTSEINSLDGKISAAMSAGEGDDKLKAFKAYGKAMNMMDEREGLNAMLRVCDPSGKGIEAPVSIADLAGKFEEASGNFRLGLDLVGSGAAKVKDCIMEQLGNKGYQIEEIEVKDEDEEEEEGDDEDGKGKFDAILRGKLKSEKAGEIAGSIMVRTELSLKLVNGKSNKTLKTFNAQRKEGRRDVKSSASLSAFKMCQQEAPKIAAAIDQYFKK